AVRAEFRFETVTAIARSNGLSCERLAWPHPDMQKWLIIRRADSTFAVPAFDDRMRISNLEQELANCTARLRDVEHHPYVRLGKRISHAVRLLKLHAMRIFAILRKSPS